MCVLTGKIYANALQSEREERLENILKHGNIASSWGFEARQYKERHKNKGVKVHSSNSVYNLWGLKT